MRIHPVLTTILVFALLVPSARAQLAPTALTYQGTLNENGAPADGAFPMTFRLFNNQSSGSQVGPTLAFPTVLVEQGLFDQRLDFGAIDSGTTPLYLEVEVNGFTMSPRTPIAASPYALQTRGIHVDNTGNIGVGTTTPSADLDIQRPGATLALDSTSISAPRLTFQGNDASPFSGNYAAIDFLNPQGAMNFAFTHGNAFGSPLFRFLSPSNPSGLLIIDESGSIGIADIPSAARVHIADTDIGNFTDALLNDTMVLEDSDTVLGLYSSNSGSYGSAISFAEIIDDELTDKWGLVRLTSSAPRPELRVTFGPNPNYAQNPLAVAFIPGGLAFPDGSVQTSAVGARASRAFGGDISFIPVITDRFIGPLAQVEITREGQQVVVLGSISLQSLEGEALVSIAYRPRGQVSPITHVLPTTGVRTTGTELVITPVNGLIVDIPVGSWDVGIFVREPNEEDANAFHREVSVIAIVVD